MKFHSTRGKEPVTLVDAIMTGLAPDGGLYVPDRLPTIQPDELSGHSLAEISAGLLQPFFDGSEIASDLEAICTDALNFPLPMRAARGENSSVSVLELFHGPTAAFKDVGARFLAACMERIESRSGRAGKPPLTILVATSGDTGGAVAAAFHRRAGVRVAVLFPRGQVSERQRHQLTCWGDNVLSLEVAGNFDDCQALVKAAFGSPELNERFRFSAANSINLGRLLPQVAYHATAALWYWRETGKKLNLVVPTGNLGNGLACIWARAIGMPIDQIMLAVNANQTVPEYLQTGEYNARSSIRTLASAMDVGDPSNMERLRQLVPDWQSLRQQLRSHSVSDSEIRQQIASDFEQFGEIWCPHTATGFAAYDALPQSVRDSGHWAVCATAHPAKFESIVEPVINREVAVPAELANILELPSRSVQVEPQLEAVDNALSDWATTVR